MMSSVSTKSCVPVIEKPLEANPINWNATHVRLSVHPFSDGMPAKKRKPPAGGQDNRNEDPFTSSRQRHVRRSAGTIARPRLSSAESRPPVEITQTSIIGACFRIPIPGRIPGIPEYPGIPGIPMQLQLLVGYNGRVHTIKPFQAYLCCIVCGLLGSIDKSPFPEFSEMEWKRLQTRADFP
jgi:hypothetical protein